jgi:hypothetical protein
MQADCGCAGKRLFSEDNPNLVLNRCRNRRSPPARGGQSGALRPTPHSTQRTVEIAWRNRSSGEGGLGSRRRGSGDAGGLGRAELGAEDELEEDGEVGGELGGLTDATKHLSLPA